MIWWTSTERSSDLASPSCRPTSTSQSRWPTSWNSSGAQPRRRIELAVTGDCRGQRDGPRLQQSLRNLVSNAIKCGAPDTPVRVALRSSEADVRLEVTNSGPAIEPAALSQIFDPLKRGVAQGDSDAQGSLGLRLFIVREIAQAHGGDVQVHSEQGETTFSVRLPRRERSSRNGCDAIRPDAGLSRQS